MTAVPRSLASALSPMAAGNLLARSTFGWPLLIGGLLKALYDVLPLLNFRALPTPEERQIRAAAMPPGGATRFDAAPPAGESGLPTRSFQE